MKILDRYILGKYFKTFLFVVVLLNIVICVVDYTDKADDFLRSGVGFDKIFFDYYVNYFIFMASSLSPISVFIAVVFITARMASHSEVVAALSSGQSFRRFMLPYFMGACVLAIAIFGLVGWIIPNAAKTKVAFEIEYIRNPFYFDERNIHIKNSDSTYIYLESYNNRINVGYKFTIEKIRDRQLLEKLSAERIEWDTLRNKWFVEKYRIMQFTETGEKMIEGTDMDTVLNISPRYFESRYKLNETMTFDELETFIQEEIARGTGNIEVYLNEKYERYAYPFAVIILSLMGVIVSARKSRGGSGLQIAFGFVLAFVYILFVIMSRSVAAAGSVSPMMAAWLPNIVFSFVALVMYFTVPR